MIRYEVQVTPNINGQYYWRVYRLIDNVDVTLSHGLEDVLYAATTRAAGCAVDHANGHM